MPVPRNANIHKHEPSKRRGFEVPRANIVSQTMSVSRCSEQQRSRDSDDSAGSAADELGGCVCELDGWRAGGAAGRDGDGGGGRSGTSRLGWDDGAVITTAASGYSVAG